VVGGGTGCVVLGTKGVLVTGDAFGMLVDDAEVTTP
jgi:hypothetical protein